MTACGCGAVIRTQDRKYSGPCAECGASTCPAHTFFRVDESNIAITTSARPMCADHARSRKETIRE